MMLKKKYALPAVAVGAIAFGSFAIGALAVGALAIATLSINRLSIYKGKMKITRNRGINSWPPVSKRTPGKGRPATSANESPQCLGQKVRQLNCE